MYDIAYKSRIDNKVELLKEYTFEGITVPKGYISDGLSIPYFYRLAVNKYSPKYLPCAIVHDYLTDVAYEAWADTVNEVDVETYHVGKFMYADNMFEKMLTIADGGVISYRAKVMVNAVRLWHKFKYSE